MSSEKNNTAKTDVESLKAYSGYEHDLKKTQNYAEMVSVRALTTRIYWQCVFIFCIIGITLAVIIFRDPYSYASPIASHVLSFGGAIMYVLLLGALLTCSQDASTRLVLIITVSIFMGLCIGFLMSLNITLQTIGTAGEAQSNVDDVTL